MAILSDLHSSFKGYCDAAQQVSMAALIKLRDFRNGPDFFQKICQVTSASLQLLGLSRPLLIDSLTRFSFVLRETAKMHDFYRIIQEPVQWLFPVDMRAIDQTNVLGDLTDYLYDCRAREKAENFFEQGLSQERESLYQECLQIAKECLTEQFTHMSNTNDAYRNVEEFIKVIEARLKAKTHIKENGQRILFDLSQINLNYLTKNNPKYNVTHWIRLVPLAERIVHANWTLVNMGSPILNFRDWNLLNTAKYAEQIGQYQGFQWIKEQSLDIWVTGLVCSAFAWQLFESVRKLTDDALTPQEKRQARWDAVTSFAEIVLHGTNFLNLIGKTKIDNAYIQCFAIGAKSLGLLSIATRPSPEFFQKTEVA